MNAEEFMDALRLWVRGDEDSIDADIAGALLGETLLLHRAWLRAHIKK